MRGSVEGYPSGQRGQTVNLLAHAFGGSNPPPSTTLTVRETYTKRIGDGFEPAQPERSADAKDQGRMPGPRVLVTRRRWLAGVWNFGGYALRSYRIGGTM